MHFKTAHNRLFITESFSPIRAPKRYLNQYGQFLEHSPYCERDIKLPELKETFDEKGDLDRNSYLVEVKNGRQVVVETLGPLGKK